jgi:hypothetical protein
VWTSLLPNPVRDGFSTRGPPRSVQLIRQSPSGAIVHATASVPSGTDSDPYFAALVISSWTTSAITPNVRSSSPTGRPAIVTRSGRDP